MSKNKGLAGFGSVANTNNVINNKPKVETDLNNDININTNVSTKQSTDYEVNDAVGINNNHEVDNGFKAVIDNVIGVQTIQPKKKQISAYVDEDVAKMLDKFGKKYGKGAKSNLINELLRNSLK